MLGNRLDAGQKVRPLYSHIVFLPILFTWLYISVKARKSFFKPSSTGRAAIACDHPSVWYELLLGHWALGRQGHSVARHSVARALGLLGTRRQGTQALGTRSQHRTLISLTVNASHSDQLLWYNIQHNVYNKQGWIGRRILSSKDPMVIVMITT